MKKLGMLIVMLMFAGMHFASAQQQAPQPPQQPQQMGPVREYIQKDILPVVKQEHAKFINALTASEKKELAKVQTEFKNLRPGPGMRGTNHPQMKNNRAKVKEMMDQVKKIADAHPKAAAAYKKAIEAKTAEWTKAIQEIREKNAQGYGRGMKNDRTPRILDRISDPAFGLLFDGKNFPRPERPGMRPGGGPGMGPGGGPGMGPGNFSQRGMYNRQMSMGMKCSYGQMGRSMGYHQPMGRNYGQRGGYQGYQRPMHRGAALNPEVKKALLAYAQKNIFPVLNKERVAFDKVLKNSEKKELEVARKNIGDLKAQMKKFREMKPRVPGQRMNDSAHMALRVNMEKNMLVVHEIALKHYSELQATMKNLRQYMPKWREGIHEVMAKQMGNEGFNRPMGPGCGKMMPPPEGRMMQKHMRKGMSAGTKFLLYDPAHPGENFMPFNK